MGELDDKPKEYFEKTKKEVSCKNALAKQVDQHKMQNVDTSDDERKVDQEYQMYKRKQNWVSSICEKKIQELKEQDYLSLKGLKMFLFLFLFLFLIQMMRRKLKSNM